MQNIVIITAGSAYLFLAYGALVKKENFSISSFLLWIAIDILMWRNTRTAETDERLIAVYTICTTIFSLILLLKQKFEWKKSDSFIAGIAIVLLFVSYTTDATTGVISGALAIFIAGIPNMKKLLRIQNPQNWLLWAGVFFLVAPIINIPIFIIENKSFKEFIYPLTASCYWIIILISFFKKINYCKK